MGRRLLVVGPLGLIRRSGTFIAVLQVGWSVGLPYRTVHHDYGHDGVLLSEADQPWPGPAKDYDDDGCGTMQRGCRGSACDPDQRYPVQNGVAWDRSAQTLTPPTTFLWSKTPCRTWCGD